MDENHKNYDTSIPQLVSYPRTGSHWLKTVMERYLKKGTLPIPYFPETSEFWAYHLHDRFVGRGDEGVTKNFDKVIYLYREPIDVIFSQLTFLKRAALLDNRPSRGRYISSKYDVFRQDNVKRISEEYFSHLKRWLYDNDDIKEIIFVTYKKLKNEPIKTLGTVLKFLNYEVDEDALDKAYKETTIESVSRQTTRYVGKRAVLTSIAIDQEHFNVNDDGISGYDLLKQRFIEEYGQYVDKKFSEIFKE
tara:strand:- start:380 stop:1123 length:744 start_codon:yes stop_codon:yes gene_type:complete